MKDIILLTYNINNLGISYEPIINFVNEGDYRLTIINDNPNVKVKFNFDKVEVINHEENLGILRSRLDALKLVANRVDSDYLMFMDDDDVLLSFPGISDNYAKAIGLYCSAYDIESLLFTYTGGVPKPRYGVSGCVYNTNYVKEFINNSYDLIIELVTKHFGTDYILGGDDDILDELFYIYFKHKYPNLHYAYELKVITFLYNEIMPPKNKYGKVENDPRYSEGNNDLWMSNFNNLKKDYYERIKLL